jgi:hypothetical protein
VKRQAALRLAQIKGSDQTTLEAAYSGAWASALDGAEVPLSAFKDVTMMICKELAQVIASNANHPARTFIYGRSADLANLASTPSTDNGGSEFLGVFDSVADSSTNAPLTLQPTETLADMADPFFSDTALYYFNITGNQIRHTRPLAYLQGCVWNQTTQEALYDADGQCPLPEVCANMLVNGMVANSIQVGWSDNTSAAQRALELYQQGIQLLSTGMPNIPLASQNAVAG